MSTEKIPRSVGVHDGAFHADEVTACALLIFTNLVDAATIFRSRDPAVLNKCEFICDVGGIYDPEKRLFDHHQADYQGLHSSAGMVLKYLKEQQHLSEEVYHHFNNSLIIGIDDHDNGRALLKNGYSSISDIVSNFAPIDRNAPTSDQDATFLEAVDFMLQHLTRLHDRFQYIRSCGKLVDEAMVGDNECLFFENNIPWMDRFFEAGGDNHPALFIIMPSGQHWKLRGIPPSINDPMNVRLPLPKEWAGLLEGDLKEVTGIPGAIFCHKGRFISVWETKEEAFLALKAVLKLMRSPS